MTHAAPEFITPLPGWARAAANFDARAFGVDAWSLEQWIYELSDGVGVYRAAVGDSGISAIPRIRALGGVSPGPEAEILTIAVDAAERGTGLGGALLAELMRIAIDGGAEQIFLEVRARNVIARTMYSERGFVVVGTRPRYYSDDDALIMRYDVAVGASDSATL